MKRVKAGTSKAAAAARKAKFVEAMLSNNGNATEAAKVAGFSPKTARQQGQRLLSNVDIASEIARRRAEVLVAAQEKTSLTVEGVLEELRRIVHADPRKFFDKDGNLLPITDLDDATVAALAGVEVVEEFAGRGENRELIGYIKKVKFWDKNSAIDKAMKHLGLFEKDNKQKPVVVGPIDIRFV